MMHTTKRTAPKSPVQSILTAAVKDARAEMRGVRVLSKVLAEMMQEMHGETWKAHIDHDNGFILITHEVA